MLRFFIDVKMEMLDIYQSGDTLHRTHHMVAEKAMGARSLFLNLPSNV